MAETPEGEWVEPPWQSPLDAEAALRAIPPSATITGMFIDAVVKLAGEKGHAVPSARARYVAFQTYPLREHCEVLCEVGAKLYPDVGLRQALRRLGKGAPHVLMQSTIGRVVLGSAEGPLASLKAMADSYTHHMRPGNLEVSATGERAAVVKLTDVYNFLDSHNVGVFEGLMRHAGLEGRVLIQSYHRDRKSVV